MGAERPLGVFSIIHMRSAKHKAFMLLFLLFFEEMGAGDATARRDAEAEKCVLLRIFPKFSQIRSSIANFGKSWYNSQ